MTPDESRSADPYEDTLDPNDAAFLTHFLEVIAQHLRTDVPDGLEEAVELVASEAHEFVDKLYPLPPVSRVILELGKDGPNLTFEMR